MKVLLRELNFIFNNMPFRAIKSGKNKGKYKSPSGRIFSKKQVIAYYATNGFRNKVKKKVKKKTKRK